MIKGIKALLTNKHKELEGQYVLLVWAIRGTVDLWTANVFPITSFFKEFFKNVIFEKTDYDCVSIFIGTKEECSKMSGKLEKIIDMVGQNDI